MSILNEGMVKDIIEIISDTKDLLGDKNKMIGSKKSSCDPIFKSLTKNANNLTLVFPVMCTKGISVETASMLTKAIEKNCVNLLQMLFAAMQVSNAAITLQAYISKFHKNMTVSDKLTVDDFLDFTNSISESVDSGELKITDKELYNNFKQHLAEFTNIAKISLNEKSLSDFTCQKTINGYDTVLERSNSEIDKEFKQKADFISKLESNDIKKANELMPTKVIVDFSYLDDNSGLQKIERGIIGVKCKLYPVDSMEIIERIASKYADTNWVREIVRASTGEISFWRDFVFALDRAKVDAVNSSRKGSSAKMWKVLERRATKNKLSKWKANRANSSPITTLIVSQDEVEYLKKEYDINLENRNIATKLMSEYNFMGLAVVDEPAESASFIWDEGADAQYETLSFRNLERESDDKNYRKVINLMTKISR